MQRISITNPQNIIDGTAKKYYFKLRNTGGPKGDKGDKGDTGATGPQGPQGNAATVSIGSTTTLPVGYDATVTNAGSIYNAVLDFGIPQGPQGPQGAKGDKGDTGAKGDTGPRGPQGERGTNATVYIGTTTTLNPGSQATVYNSGTDSNAVLNFGIPRGEKGETGATGATGATGPAGQNFTPTIVAELPATGDSSKLYLTPKAHTTQTATGNPVTASVTEQAGSMESFQLDGDTFQQSYTGKNIFNYTTLADGTYNGVTASYDPQDQAIVLNGTCTTNNTAIPFNITPFSVSGDQTISYEVIDGTISNATTDTRAILFQAGYASSINVQLAQTDGSASFTRSGEYTIARIRADNGVAFQNYKIRLQLELSATATTFEPYVGGVPSPNPDYPQTIQTVTGLQTIEIIGNNIFDKSNIVNLYNAVSSVASNANAKSVIVKCLPNTTYTYSNPDGASMKSDSSIGFYPSEPVAGLGKTGANADISTNTSLTFTTPADTEYMLLYFAWSNAGSEDNIQKIQIEVGSTATAYAPYSKQALPINLGKNLLNAKDNLKTSASGLDFSFSDNKLVVSGTPTATYANVTNKIDVDLPAGDYTLSISNAINHRVYLYIDYEDSTTDSLCVINAGSTSRTATFAKRAVKIRLDFSYMTTGTALNESFAIQLETGSTATAYAPYKTPIELCKLGTYQDYIYKDGNDWKVHKATSSATIDSLVDGESSSIDTAKANTTRVKIDKCLGEQASYAGRETPVCNEFVYKLIWSSDESGFYLDIGSDQSKNGIVFRGSKNVIGTTDTAIESWLNSNPITVYYAIATATDTTITDTTLISQLEAVRTASLQSSNTITNTATGSNLAGDMEISYYGYNPTNRYDKFIWLDLNNAYEQLNNPDTSSTLSTLSTRTLGTTTEQPTVTRSLETETITLKKGETEPIEDKTELPTILDEEAEETETTEPEESDGTDER